MRSMRVGRWTSPCIERADDGELAQATVEVAFLLPCFLLLMLVLLQPVCVLYTRSVMEAAAAQTARLMATADAAEQESDMEAYRAFAVRRLAAVPDVSIFHVGGPLAWEIECTDAASTGGRVQVSIEGAVRPLPVLGVFAHGVGEVNAQGDIVVHVEVAYDAHPGWLHEGSGEGGS